MYHEPVGHTIMKRRESQSTTERVLGNILVDILQWWSETSDQKMVSQHLLRKTTLILTLRLY